VAAVAAVAQPPVVPPLFAADYLNNPTPAYPRLSRELGEQGKVLLRVQVSAEGEAKAVLVETGSGHERLDQSAVLAVRNWRFVPARQGSRAIEAWVLVPISFSLRR
jgi:protein TonB